MLAYLGPCSTHDVANEAKPYLWTFKPHVESVAEDAYLSDELEEASRHNRDVVTQNTSIEAQRYIRFPDEHQASSFSATSDSSSSSCSPILSPLSSPPQSVGEKQMVIHSAIRQCEIAASISQLKDDERLIVLDTAFTEFSNEIQKVSNSKVPYTLISDTNTRGYSELDFFGAIRFISSPTERAKLWKRMAKFYRFHERPPHSFAEHNQLATLFFHSCYVQDTSIDKLITKLSRHITADPYTGGNFALVLGQLSTVANEIEQSEVADRLLARLEVARRSQALEAIEMYCKFLPKLLNAHRARTLLEYALMIDNDKCKEGRATWLESLRAELVQKVRDCKLKAQQNKTLGNP